MADLNQIAKRAASLNAEIKARGEELAQLKEKLIAGGEAKYDGVNVIFPAAPVGAPAKIEDAQEIAGPVFGKLFSREIVFKPVKNFRDVVAAVLTPAKAKKLIVLCTGEARPQVRFS